MAQCMAQNAFSSCEEIRGTLPALDRRDSVVCPKPRRVGIFGQCSNDPIRPLRWQLRSHQVELCDSRAGSELLDIILTKGRCGPEHTPSPVASSPPYFCGSPPSRAGNPLVHDDMFGKDKFHSASLIPIPSDLPSSPSSPSPCKGGWVRTTLGPKPATVRVEGFICLDRDGQNCSISTVV